MPPAAASAKTSDTTDTTDTSDTASTKSAESATPVKPAKPKRLPRIDDFPPTGANALAAFTSRGWARMIDALVTDVPVLILQGLLLAPTLTSDLQPTPATDELTRTLTPWLVAAWALLAVVYETTAIAWRGQTLGKWIIGLRVARYTDGQKPQWAQSALRCLLPVCAGALTFKLTGIPALGAFCIFASSYFSELRRGWHDEAGGTIVVRSR